MNKSSYQPNRNIKTQNNFRKRAAQSPFRSQKSFEEGSKVDSVKMEMLLNRQHGITSTSWCIFDSENKQWIGIREDHQREVASLTKIMTCIVSLQLFQRYSMEQDIMIRISPNSSSLAGTTAELKEGKYIKLFDLFYGAMLPSGNDAAFLLAEVFGLLLFYESVKPENKDYSQIQSIDLSCYETTTTFVSRFLKEMNKKAKELRMSKTVFTNPHGLANILNVSSARDMVTLSKYCWESKTFRQIANCEEYKTHFYQDDMETVYCKKIWSNTNKLLGLGWQGIKTGITNPAGACLASVREGVFIVVLNCSNREARFNDTLALWEWHRDSRSQRV